MPLFPRVLVEIEDFLQYNEVELSISGRDGRLDSAGAEEAIFEKLKASGRWNVSSPNETGHTRAWYDMKVIEGMTEYFVDIKVSNFSSADNTNAKKATYYLLTGLSPEGVPDQDGPFFESMRANDNPDEDRDYYYLVVNKNNPRDAFLCSLKTLTQVTSNPSNLPFQANWDKNRDAIYRSWQEAKNWLLSYWAVSLQKKIENTMVGMPKHYPEFFESQGKEPLVRSL